MYQNEIFVVPADIRNVAYAVAQVNYYTSILTIYLGAVGTIYLAHKQK